MGLVVISVLVFLTCMGLVFSAFYFFVEAPVARKQMRVRLEALQQTSLQGGGEFHSTIMRRAILSRIPSLNQLLLRLPSLLRLELFFQRSGTKATVDVVVSISFALALLTFVVGLAFPLPLLMILPLAVGAAAIPFAVISYKTGRRARKFEELFPDAIDLLARAVRAGHSFTTGLELIATEMAEPVAGEFRMTYDQQNLGLPLRDALQNLSLRMPLPDVRIFVTALQIQRETGGNLAEILDNLAEVIRERFKLYRQVRTVTAEGRLSLMVLMAIPPVAALLFFITNREYIMTLVTDPLGHTLIGGAVISQTLGYFIIRKIIQIKV
jgi:tight adherence protein B